MLNPIGDVRCIPGAVLAIDGAFLGGIAQGNKCEEGPPQVDRSAKEQQHEYQAERQLGQALSTFAFMVRVLSRHSCHPLLLDTAVQSVAYGIDRLVAILMGLDSIRDSIAFPKTQKGTCLLTDAPSDVDAKQLKELGIMTVNKGGQKHG